MIAFCDLQCLIPAAYLFSRAHDTCAWVCRHWPGTCLCWCHGCTPQWQSGSVTECRRCCAGFCCWVPGNGKNIMRVTWQGDLKVWSARKSRQRTFPKSWSKAIDVVYFVDIRCHLQLIYGILFFCVTWHTRLHKKVQNLLNSCQTFIF